MKALAVEHAAQYRAALVRVEAFLRLALRDGRCDREKMQAELAAVSEALRGPVESQPARRCQHQLRREDEQCRHGFYFGSTCGFCARACQGCASLYRSGGRCGSANGDERRAPARPAAAP